MLNCVVKAARQCSAVTERGREGKVGKREEGNEVACAGYGRGVVLRLC